jgi:site-specific recombinase XerD
MQVEAFLAHLTSRGHTHETLKAYRVDLALFRSFLQEHDLILEKVTPATSCNSLPG